MVVKADGLAAGKGVVVALTLDEALNAVHGCFDGAFGDAGSTVVIEEMLTGPECTLLAFTDGKTVRPMATSQDHKRALEGDLGPNTGGMGVYSPVPIVTPEEHAEMCRILEETIAATQREGIDYRGCLYGGFMLTPQGPKVIEYNARFGDPETEVLMPRLRATWSRSCWPAPSVVWMRSSLSGATSGPSPWFSRAPATPVRTKRVRPSPVSRMPRPWRT